MRENLWQEGHVQDVLCLCSFYLAMLEHIFNTTTIRRLVNPVNNQPPVEPFVMIVRLF